MPVPSKHDNEPRTEIQGDLYADWVDARDQMQRWTLRAEELRRKLEEQLGEATAGTIHGRVMLTYRYKSGYATRALIRDFPALTEDYMRSRVVEELDMDAFVASHPDLAARYRIRELRRVSSVEEESDGE